MTFFDRTSPFRRFAVNDYMCLIQDACPGSVIEIRTASFVFLDRDFIFPHWQTDLKKRRLGIIFL